MARAAPRVHEGPMGGAQRRFCMRAHVSTLTKSKVQHRQPHDLRQALGAPHRVHPRRRIPYGRRIPRVWVGQRDNRIQHGVIPLPTTVGHDCPVAPQLHVHSAPMSTSVSVPFCPLHSIVAVDTLPLPRCAGRGTTNPLSTCARWHVDHAQLITSHEVPSCLPRTCRHTAAAELGSRVHVWVMLARR
jgi:hypothetical protein